MPRHQLPAGLISCKDAGLLMGLSGYGALREATLGLVETVALPGYPVLFKLASVERRAAELGRVVKPRSRQRPKPAAASA